MLWVTTRGHRIDSAQPKFNIGDRVEVTTGEYAGLEYVISDIAWHARKGWAYGGKISGRGYTFYSDRLTLSQRL